MPDRQPDKQTLRLEFPMAGRVDRYAFQRQPPYSTISCRNVWPDAQRRERGGSRPGFGKLFSTNLGSPVIGMGTINFVNAATHRIVSRLAAVAGQRLYYSDDASTLIFEGTLPHQSDQLLTMTERNQKLYIACHSTTPALSASTDVPRVYDPITGAIDAMSATAGTVPTGCPCICTWRDRIVFAGGTTTPYGVFMSRQGDPTDWDYSATDASGAVSLGLASAGQVGETVTSLTPHADNCIIIGCPTSLWLLQGDPKSGGQLANLSSTVGVVDRNAWCTTPDGLFVFLSQDGLYMVPAGCASTGNPISISREKLPLELLNLNPIVGAGGKVCSLAYDVRYRGVHIFVTDRDLDSDDAGSIHWFYDWEQKSFFEVQYGLAAMDPYAAHARRNYYSAESVVVAGCRDGYVRSYTSTDTKDDEDDSTSERPIASHVVLGPFSDDPPLARDVRIDELDFIMAADSGDVNWKLYRGNTAEEAFQKVTDDREVTSGLLGPGRNYRSYPRVNGSALFLKLYSTAAWAFEAATALMTRTGRTRV